MVDAIVIGALVACTTGAGGLLWLLLVDAEQVLGMELGPRSVRALRWSAGVLTATLAFASGCAVAFLSATRG